MQSNTSSDLIISSVVADAMGADDAAYMRKDFLEPASLQLIADRGDVPAASHLRSQMAQAILSIMEAFAATRHLGVATQMGFTTALAFCIPDPKALPAFGLERMFGQDHLMSAIAIPNTLPGYRGINCEDEFFTVFGATLLAAARAVINTPEGANELCMQNSMLASASQSVRFLRAVHGHISSKGMMRMLDESEIGKIRLVLDIVEKHLPHVEMPAL